MKKFAAVILALVLILSVAALAETKMFALTTITDMESNVVATVTEDGNAIDANGNDVSDEFPIFVFQLDDESMTCTFGDEEEVLNGTIEITEQTEDGVALWVTLEDGEEFEIVYTTAGINACTYLDEENGLAFIMPEIG